MMPMLSDPTLASEVKRYRTFCTASLASEVKLYRIFCTTSLSSEVKLYRMLYDASALTADLSGHIQDLDVRRSRSRITLVESIYFGSLYRGDHH